MIKTMTAEFVLLLQFQAPGIVHTVKLSQPGALEQNKAIINVNSGISTMTSQNICCKKRLSFKIK